MAVFEPYGEYDYLVHEWYLYDSQGTPQPWVLADMDTDIEYSEVSVLYVYTVDAQTQQTTLTLRHIMQDPRIV